MSNKKWYDVHFLLTGYVNVEANNEQEAKEIVEKIFERKIQGLEDVAETGLGFYTEDIIESAAQEN